MTTTADVPFRLRSLSDLQRTPLVGHFLAIWEAACAGSSGPPALRQRLSAEARDLLVLAQSSGRLHVHWLDLAAGLRAKVEMETPVPCLPDPAGPLQVASRALLGITYPQSAILLPQPGYSFIRVLEPRAVWLPNISPDPHQALCLGQVFPGGTPLSQLLLIVFGALSMQTAQFDKFDSAGVLNPAAADWWQRNTDRIPLTREPFLKPEPSHGA